MPTGVRIDVSLEQIEALTYNLDGLIPAIAQDHETREVLMMAWMNAEALEKTAQTGLTHFFSRSRQKMWLKGESSGHVQEVVQVLLAVVNPGSVKPEALDTLHHADRFFRGLVRRIVR